MRLQGLMNYLRKNIWDIYDNCLDYYWDLKYSISTRGLIQPYQFKSTSMSLVHSRAYQGCRYRDLQKSFKYLPNTWMPKDSKFIDLGSGKGRVLFMAKRFGINNSIGIELCSSLCEIAKTNLEIHNPQTQIINSDILEVDSSLYGNDPIFFLYNSFDSQILIELLYNLKQSNINARFILANPRSRLVFINNGYQLVRQINSFDFNRVIEYYEPNNL
jgi:SAM-dependent methyltransferase